VTSQDRKGLETRLDELQRKLATLDKERAYIERNISHVEQELRGDALDQLAEQADPMRQMKLPLQFVIERSDVPRYFIADKDHMCFVELTPGFVEEQEMRRLVKLIDGIPRLLQEWKRHALDSDHRTAAALEDCQKQLAELFGYLSEALPAPTET
jgi:hypothetical protein